MSTTGISIGDPVGLFKQAEGHLEAGRDLEAKTMLRRLLNSSGVAPVALFRLGEIENKLGNAKDSETFHRRAFSADARLASRITSTDHPFHGYAYRDIDQTVVSDCPLCGKTGRHYWTFNMVTNMDFNEGFDPVRSWMICDSCNHIYASAFPSDLDRVLSDSDNEQYEQPKTGLLSYNGSIISRLRRMTDGRRLFEIGVGAGELMAVAAEFGFNVTGLEIRPSHAERVSRMIDLPVVCADFADYDTPDRYDVICMGDVLEHFRRPTEAIAKVAELLIEKGLIWISTPNHESAFSRIMKDRDPMKRVCEHMNYFSFKSLRNLLGNNGMEVVDYRISAHYNGSMEVVAIKR
ncbi:MAG: class I SAM-dependent methyltransferase [Bacteroidales bacterium]|nr:class I SAM-dependent methyltransferase [Candidatus Latescibacterota bacterium]